ncbi:MAG: hypothetical protein ABI992_06670 [Chthoniobacterales bacterium]
MRPSNFLALLLRLLACLTLVAQVAGSARAAESQDETPAQLKQGIEGRHPADYYKLAAKLFQDASTKQEAVFWFYVGQLRYRYYLAANPELKPDGDPAVFSSLSEVIGRPINEFAGGKPDLWIGEINHALEWDAAHENGFTAKSKAPDKYQQIRAGLVAMRDQLSAMKTKLPEMRRQNGLK